MKKKIFVLLVFLIFITGCDVKSNIEIFKDLSVVETVSMSGTSSFFNNYYKTLPINVLKKMIDTDSNKKLLDENGYKYHINKKEKYPALVAEKKYLNLKEYSENTIYKNFYFRNFETIENDNLITLKASDFIIGSEVDDEDRYIVSICTYSIKLPFVVTSSNADKVDKSTNTYTWQIDEKTENKEINITFDKSRIYIYNILWYISLIIIIILTIIATIYIIKTIKKNRKNNFLN